MTQEEVGEFFRGLRSLRDSCSGNMKGYDRLAVLITACIDVGFDSRPQLIGALRRLNYTEAYVSKVLTAYEGTQWRRGSDRRYVLQT